MIYFDNSATTFKKPKSVYKRLIHYLKNECGNPGRSSHELAIKSAEAVYETREVLARLFKVEDPAKIVFTQNATYALNFAIKSFIKEKCHIIISDVEHNSVLRPLHILQNEFGIEYSVFKSEAENLYSEIEKHIREDTKAIISTLVSNVDGREIPLRVLSSIKKAHGIKLIVDASQAAGHKEINLTDTSCDAIAMPGHKGLLGIQGVGICIFPEEIPDKTIIEGGSGYDSKSRTMPEELPEKFEAGTLPTPAIISLCEGTKFILKTSVEKIEERIDTLTNYLTERLANIKDIDLVRGKNGVISFRATSIAPEDLACELDKYGICTRAGFHCSPLAHKTLGTYDSGTVRVSLSYFNTKAEIDAFTKALNKILLSEKKRGTS